MGLSDESDNLEARLLEARLAAFYEQEAAARATRPLPAERADVRARFVELLEAEGRRSVVDIGAGPGHDVGPMVDAGLRVAAVDLAPAHVALCQQQGAEATVGSMFDLPFESAQFDAGWTMSTLLHVPDERFDDAMAEISRCLVPGAPLAVGVWGGTNQAGIVDQDHHEPRRFFVARTDHKLRSMLQPHGELESWRTWHSPHLDEIYQFCVLRIP